MERTHLLTSFQDFGLADPISRALKEENYLTPTPIQAQTIPLALAGRDVVGIAQTGTGKTAAFALPILHRILENRIKPQPKACRVLVLSPTRELSSQILESFNAYGRHIRLTSALAIGGVPMGRQVRSIMPGVEVMVATPGRLLDLVQSNGLKLGQVEFLVLDEADRMLDMGFIRDIKKILAKLPSKRQNLLFSATFSEEIKELADGLLNAPAMIEVARRNTTAETVSQKVHPVDRDKKRELLTHLIKEHNWFQVLVFTRTKHGANRLAEQLSKDGIPSLAIHGNKSQSARTRALSEFKDATLQVLVATDIAARGIDIDQLPHVVNYDLPNVAEDYVHRIGRTGRAGSTGEAVSLVCVDEHELLTDIEKLIKRQLTKEVIAGFEPDPTARPQPIQLRSQGGGGGGGRQQQPKRAGSGGGGGGGARRAPAAPGGGGQANRGPRPARSGPAPAGAATNGAARRSGGRGR